MSTAYLIYGKSGSGKGTQAGLLKERLESQGRKVIYIETGKLLRAFAASHKNLTGERVSSIIDAGGLMPAFFPVYLWAREFVENYTGAEDIITDGVGRRIAEAPLLDSVFDFFDVKKRYVITINVSDDWVLEHKGNRGRVDDSDEGTKKRLGWFQTDVVPVLEYFKNNASYQSVTINGEQSIEEVARDIQDAVG